MPTIVDKNAVVELLRHEFAVLRELCTTLTPDQWDTPTCLPGWSVRDVLSHVIGTEAMLLGEQAPEADLSHLTFLANPVAEANQLWVEAMRACPGREMITRLTDVTGRRLAALDAMDQADFDAPSWTPVAKDETYGRFMRIRHYDCYLHEDDIRQALGLAARQEVADLSSALDEVETGLGYIVGRRAGLADGTRVRIVLTGPLPVTYLVEVDGRASVVDELTGPPTIGLELPAMLFLRLTGGRQRLAEDVPEQEGLLFSGDEAAARRLVEHLAFTI